MTRSAARSKYLQAWRDRLALQLRNFRRIRGRWPEEAIVQAARRGIQQAVAKGFKPVTLH